MNNNEYQNTVKRTSGTSEYAESIILAAMGISGESGEICDIIKKHVFYGHGLDYGHMQEEIGYLLWYIAHMCNTLGLRIDMVMEANIMKLEKSYPNGFDKDKSINRED